MHFYPTKLEGLKVWPPGQQLQFHLESVRNANSQALPQIRNSGGGAQQFVLGANHLLSYDRGRLAGQSGQC